MTRDRIDGWEDALAARLDAALSEPFVWGSHDCAHFTAGTIEAITGRRPASWLGGYASEAEAEAWIAERGGIEAITAGAMEEFGATEIPWQMAQRGDLVLLEVGNEVLLGIVAGDKAAAVASDGLHYVPVARCARRCWAI